MFYCAEFTLQYCYAITLCR